MKKWLSVLLIMCLCIPSALAGEDAYYYPYSVADSASSVAKYKSFDAASTASILIPGCAQDFVPQGIAYLENENWMIISGYSSDQFASTLLAVDLATNELVKEVFLKNMDDTYYTGHAGGICVTGKNIYISDDNHLYRISLSTFRAAPVSSSCKFEEAISVPCNASFCQYNNGVLWVGEFEHAPDYKTDPSHHLKIGNTENTGWVLGYQLTGSTANELDPSCITASGAIPNYIISTTEKIQGFTISNDMIYLSQSYGRTKDSTIYRHTNVLQSVPVTYASVYGSQVPVWFLTPNSQTGELTAPPMTEGLCTIDGKVYVSFESAASFYRVPTDPNNNTPSKDPVDRIFRLDTF